MKKKIINHITINNKRHTYKQTTDSTHNITFDDVCAHYEHENNSALVGGITLKQGSETGATILTSSRLHNYLDQLVQATTSGSGATVSFTSHFNDLNKRQRVTLQ